MRTTQLSVNGEAVVWLQAQGRFREDLFARLYLWTFVLPGLADRREDIAPNVEYELQRFSAQQQTQIRFDKTARETLLHRCSSHQSAAANQLKAPD